MKNNTKFQFLFLGLFLFLIIPMTTPIFAEKTVSIQKTTDVGKIALIDSLSHLERYSQILPDYIQSSKVTENGIGKMEIGFNWISIDTDIKFSEVDDNVILEVISGDFKGTKLNIVMVEKSPSSNTQNETIISAELSLQRSWYMELLTSFVSDDDLKSMLHTSLNGLVEFTKNPPTYENTIKEKEQFCIFGLCF